MPAPRSLLPGAAALALSVLLAGCAATGSQLPSTLAYVPASAQPGAQVHPGSCTAGPQLDADLGAGLRLQASAGPDQAGATPGVPLRLQLAVPPQTWFQLAGPVRLVADGRGVEGFLSIWAARGVDLLPGEWVDPQQLRPGQGPQAAREDEAPFGRARFHFAVPGAGPRRLVVEGLVVEREGAAAIALPPVALGALDDGADTGERPELRWRSRWTRVARAGGQALEGEVELAVRLAGPWRLVTTAARVRADGAPPLALQAAGGTLAFADRLFSGAPVPPGPTPTRVHVEAVLPPGTPAFAVQLPPLRRNAERIAVAPVTFERRSLARAASCQS